MSCYDHHTLMMLKLDRWSQGRPLRGYEIERELAEMRRPKPMKRPRRFRFAAFWRRAEA